MFESEGKQVALVTAEIKQVMAVAGLVPRWIPHNVMVVDGLTKELKKSNLKPLLQLMKSGKLKLTAEEDEVDARRQLREDGGRVQKTKEAAAKLRRVFEPTPPRISCECRKPAFGRL